MSNMPKIIFAKGEAPCDEWEGVWHIDQGVYSGESYTRTDTIPAMINKANIEANDRWRKNARETFEAMVAMRNNINEYIPMPSLESDLLRGPESGVFCATVVEAVVSGLRYARRSARRAALEEAAQIADNTPHYTRHAVLGLRGVTSDISTPPSVVASHIRRLINDGGAE